MHRRRTGPVGAENHPPSRFPRDDDEDDDGRPSRRHHRRFFSSTSAADEVVVAIKEDPPPGAAPESATATATAAATDSRERWRHRPETAGIDVVVVDDDDGGGGGGGVVPGSEEFARAWSECRASLPALDDGAASPDEVADRLLALLYSPEFERQVLMAGGEGGGVLPSRARIHHALLRTVDRCLPSPEARTSSSGEAGGGAPSSPDDRRRGGIMAYSAATVGRALRLARRAEELGLPPHRPLYRRLAVGVVLASPSPSSSSLVPPVDSPLGGEGRPIAAPPPLPLELLGILDGARSALGFCPGEEDHRRLASDVLSEPVLLLLEDKRLEEAAALLRGWKDALGGETHPFSDDLTDLLGEEDALRALDAARGWVDDPELAERVRLNVDVEEMSAMLERTLDDVIRGRRRRAERISDLLWRLSLRDAADDGDDFDENDDGDLDSEYEVEYEYEEEEEEEEEEEDNEFNVVNTRVAETVRFASLEADDEDTTTVSFRAETSKNSERESEEEGEGDESYTIIRGLSNKEARRSVYIRNSADWHLADIVPQLQDWNKGRMLTFTPMFERYVGNQITKCASDDEDDEEED